MNLDSNALNNPQYAYPPGFPEILKDLTKEVLRHQPENIIQFCATYFQNKISPNSNQETLKEIKPKESEHKLEMSSQNLEKLNSSEELDDVAPPPSFMPNIQRGRRTSVSAESMVPTDSQDQPKTVIPKTEEQKQRIGKAVLQNFLFKNLDEEQYQDVVNAMAEKKVETGEEVIKQGAVGDYFYIVETGELDVFVKKHPSPDPVKVHHYGPGGSFGELALMYNAPRAATVKATSECVLWALDRMTFRRILLETTSKKRRMYENFLEEVPLLKPLQPYERSKVADALETVQFSDGEIVIKQGDEGENFYIIESGEAKVLQTDEQGLDQELNTLKKGDYFGELALIFNKPRAATVIAKGKLKCVTLGKQAFDRLLGSALEMIRNNTSAYKALTRRKSIQEMLENMNVSAVSN